MAKAIFQDNWKNGDGGAVKEYKLEPPFQGNEVVHVSAYRTIGGRFVTAVTDVNCKETFSEVDGATACKEALALIGYTVIQ